MYLHHAKYYETDQMGIVHHSNYIRWMEEARIDFMDKMGFGYRAMEELGIISPVLSVRCEYRDMVRFDDTVEIDASIKAYNGIKLEISYVMRNLGVLGVKERESAGADAGKGASEKSKPCTLGESSHCFLVNGKPVSLKRSFPELHELFMRYAPTKVRADKS